MLDPKFISENAELVKKAAAAKHVKDAPVDRFIELNTQRKKVQTELDTFRQELKKLSQAVAASKGQDTASREKAHGVGESIKAKEAELRGIETEMEAAQHRIPNVPHESVPEGHSADDNKIIHHKGERPKFAFKPKPHWDVAGPLGILDEERAAKLSGSNFLLLKGAGARLERALINWFLDVHTREHGYTEIAPPYLVNRDCMFGTGQVPKFEDDMYRLERDNLFLIPTAEVPVTNMHRGETLRHTDIPMSYAAYTACFRRESGAYGRDTRGMVRIHQFDKVEMVKIVHPDRSWDEHETLTRHAEVLLERLGLEYRRSLMCTAEMGFSNAKQYDLEVWSVGLERWLEVSSCSNFTDFQARRMNTRFRDQDGKVKFVHTLNGSGLALPRIVISILENFQREDGSVEIPEVLRASFGAAEIRK